MTSTVAERTVNTAPWFASWFDSVHYHKLYAHRDETEATGFIDALLDTVRPEPGADVVDLGCGAGRHSRRLAARGFQVTGLDLAASSIDEAKRSAGPRLQFRRHDMRQEFGSAAFDVVLNLFTSFGYFDDPAEHLRVVRNMAQALKVGGTLVVDYLNVRDAERRLVAEEVRTIDRVTYRISRWTDASAFHKRIVVEDPSLPRPIEHRERVARFTLGDFERMFAVAGLRVEALFGDYALAAFDAETSPRLILVARRVPRSRQSSTRLAMALPTAARAIASLPHAS